MTDNAKKIEVAVVAAAVVAAVMTAVVVPALAGGAAYPARSGEAFVNECVKASSGGKAGPFCQCMFDRLQQEVPYEEFSSMDREYANRTPSAAAQNRLKRAAEACGDAS